ncbi:MAG: CehA/McbA family metallohydrolase [Clostridiales bacterium]|nr:CehA/McbA family metallohydrolase [Clostridiales bacterium]
MKKIWLRGDPHLHTTNSDGVLEARELIDACNKAGLDFIMITDHNHNSLKESYFDGDMLVIQGQEITDYLGHVNVWGKKVPKEPLYNTKTGEAVYEIKDEDGYVALLDSCRAAGAVISLNHPFCTNCPYRIDINRFDFDCVEIWNTVQHSDNMKCRDWWVGELLKGRRLAAVGGSDFHREYAFVPFLACPTTHVLCEEKSEKAVLKAIKEGRSVITNSPDSGMLYLTVGSAQVGDSVSLSAGCIAEIRAEKLRAKHTLRVYNNEKVIFEHKAAKFEKSFSAKAEIKEKGFVRAEITYRFSPFNEKLFCLGEYLFFKSKKIENIQKAKHLPDFIWAFTNPIWVE